MAKHISGTTEGTITSGAVVKEKTRNRFGDVNGRRTPLDRLINQRTEGRFRPATSQVITLARRFQICGWWMAVAGLSLYLAGRNKPQAASPGLPSPEVTVSKATQKEVVNWDEFTGRTAAVNLVTVN